MISNFNRDIFPDIDDIRLSDRIVKKVPDNMGYRRTFRGIPNNFTHKNLMKIFLRILYVFFQNL